MAFQNPQLIYKHMLRDPGAIITTSVAAAAGFPVTRLHDDMIQPKFKFSTSAANHHVTVDVRNLTFESGSKNFDNLIIPAGHNLAGASLEIRRSSEPATWPGTLVHSWTQSGNGVIFRLFASVSDDHYRLQIVTSGQFEFSELIFSVRSSLVLGPTPAFSDVDEPNFGEQRMFSGEVYRNTRGDSRRRISIVWDRLDSTAQARLDDLSEATVQGTKTFWIRSPYDDKPEPIPVRSQGTLDRVQDSPNPVATGINERFSLILLESLE